MQALGATLVAISPQTPDNSLSMAEKNALAFEVLSDPGNQVARDYKLVFSLPDGLRTLYAQIGADLTKFNGDESWELPMPGTFVIDRDGTIRLAFVDADYTKRLEAQAIIESLQELRS
jgi:peroxiredoxin